MSSICVLNDIDNKPEKRNLNVSLDNEMFEKLDFLKEYLKKNNSNITKKEIIIEALNDCFKKYKLQVCEIEETRSYKYKRKGYEIKND